MSSGLRGSRFSRRTALASFLAAPALSAAESVSIPGKRPMIVYNDRPEDLESPLEYLNTWLTPNHSFFVRQHLPRPQLDKQSFRLEIAGRVQNRKPLTLSDLNALPQVTVPATLECTGNGRGFFRPRVPGIQWGRGAIGNAEWTGPRLADVLKLVQADHNAAYVTANGADDGVAKTPDFIRSMPMRKALHPATLLALKMNGEPLPDLHGGPLRLVVPGWDGTSWVKWVTSMSVDMEPNAGFFMNPAYRFPKHALPHGAPPDPADLEVIEGMPVKSFITQPEDMQKVSMGSLAIRGVAWAGEHRITRVEVSTDGGEHWKDAEISPQDFPFAWRLWKLEWKPPAYGFYNLLSRATDSAGRMQPTVATWNPSGYLYNAIDRIGVMVERT